MMWIYPTTWSILTVWLTQIGERPDALAACFVAIASAMVCFAKEFEE